LRIMVIKFDENSITRNAELIENYFQVLPIKISY